MTGRRDLLLGAGCLLGAGAGFGLTPRRRSTLMPKGWTIDRIVPKSVRDWTSHDVSDLVAPKLKDSLAAKLYGETVGRIYTRPGGEGEIMMLLAHGDTQNDDLQLHRPEICYPAFGFAISQDARLDVDLGAGIRLPSRRLVADGADRRETIVYWSRLGQYLPVSREEQQLDRLRTAMGGLVADGLLARFSVIGPDPAAVWTLLGQFIPVLVGAVRPDLRSALIGGERATAMAAARL